MAEEDSNTYYPLDPHDLPDPYVEVLEEDSDEAISLADVASLDPGSPGEDDAADDGGYNYHAE